MLVWRYASLIWPLLLLLLLLLSMSFFFPLLAGTKVSEFLIIFSGVALSLLQLSVWEAVGLWYVRRLRLCPFNSIFWTTGTFLLGVCTWVASYLPSCQNRYDSGTTVGREWRRIPVVKRWGHRSNWFFFWGGVLSFFNAKGHLNPSKHEPATHTIC